MSGARFEVGQRVYARSIGDHNCVWVFTVTARTPRFVTFFQEGSVSRRHPEGESFRVSARAPRRPGEAEWAMPFGVYSMAPVVLADRQVGWGAPSPADLVAVTL
jgi:hypothetical protein